MSQTPRQRAEERRRAVRAQSQARRQALRDRQPFDRASRGRKRTALLIAAIVLAIVVCCCRCDLSEEPQGAAVVAPISEPADADDIDTDSATPPVAPAPLTGRVPRRDRPEYPAAAPVPVPWLDAFRLQVSARSTRLAACFIGTQHPGRLQWTTTVNATNGFVANSELEPFLDANELTRTERACVTDVLSSPPYALPSRSPSSSRVSVVIEF